MANPIQTTVTGGDEVISILKRLPGRVGRKVIGKSLKAGGEVIAKEASAQAPVLSGDLRDNIVVAVRTRRGVPVISIGPAAKIWYAHFPEYGTSTSSAKPYLRPAVQSKKDEAFGVVKRELWGGVKKEVAEMKRTS